MHDEKKSQPFLSRWSQRKMQQQGEAEERHPPIESPPRDEQQDESPSGSQPKEPQPLPDIESLDEYSDYSAFLSPEVGEDLQRMALRKLFASARFNVRDGLDDYDEDYRSFHSLGDTVTAEMRHRLERERERLGKTDESESFETPVTQQVRDEPEEESPSHEQSLDESDEGSGTG